MPEARWISIFIMQKQINGLNIEYTERGSGKTALWFSHYFGGSSRTWNEVIEGMASTCHCIAPDLRGFGASEAPAEAENYRIAKSADDMEALREELNVENFVLVGHSMGGKIALEWASRQPAGLQGLVLLAPSPPTPEPMSDVDRESLRHSHGDTEAMSKIIGEITAQTLSPEIFQRTLEDDLRVSKAAWNAWLDVGSREDISSQMTRINVPVHLLAGEKDSGMPAEMLQREVVARLSDVKFEVVPDCGHLIPVEHPQIVINAIHNILR